MGYSLEWVKKYYGLNFIKRGMRVRVYSGKFGIITSSYKSNLRIKLDGEKHPGIYHPTWDIVYYSNNGEVLSDFREVEK